MTAIDIYQVRADKVEWAKRQMFRYIPQLQEQDICALVGEISRLRDVIIEVATLDEGFRYNPQGTGFEFEFSDLQLVAFAAALSALGEVMTAADF